MQYRLYLDRPVTVRSRCYWTVEALAGGTLWNRFLVTPDARHVLKATGRQPGNR